MKVDINVVNDTSTQVNWVELAIRRYAINIFKSNVLPSWFLFAIFNSQKIWESVILSGEVIEQFFYLEVVNYFTAQCCTAGAHAVADWLGPPWLKACGDGCYPSYGNMAQILPGNPEV